MRQTVHTNGPCLWKQLTVMLHCREHASVVEHRPLNASAQQGLLGPCTAGGAQLRRGRGSAVPVLAPEELEQTLDVVRPSEVLGEHVSRVFCAEDLAQLKSLPVA